ncbi:MAG: glycosyltransferase [Treponema sp.]|nr:MAG: glycosyltransferase [Treponema sp.]
MFIDAIEKVKEKYPNIKAVMIGYGPDYQNTIDRIKVKNLQETIDVKTRLTHSEINDIYANCLLFVSSSSRAAESLGLVSIEAMMAGVPVVGSNCAAIPEYVKDGETGFLFETNNVDDLSDKIIKFLDLPEDQKRKMANGAIAMAKNYVTENVLTQLIDTLLKL